jgi:Flp pilus assembly protein TadD
VTGAGHPPSRAAARRPARAAGRRRPRHAITRGTTAAPPPLTAEHYYLGALALAEAGDLEGGVRAVRRALYLDRTLGMAHFTLGTLLRQIGDRDGARRAYTRALERCLEHAPAAALPLGDGTSAGYLAELARRQLALLAAGDQEVTP